MGIYIKDMKMPTSCPCELIGDGYDVYCSFAEGVPRYIKEYDECCQNHTRPSWCPLIEIPPHGDLIDREELEHIIGQFSLNWEYGQGVSDCWDALLNAPAIIEAEEDE